MDNDTQRQERINRAYELRLKGRTYREIGEALGVSHVSARKWVTEHLESVTLPLVDEVRKQEVDRLTRYLDRLDERVEEGDDKAIGLAIKISESLRKLLGVDVPVVSITEHVEVTSMDLDIRALIDQQNAANARAKQIAANKGQDVDGNA